MKNNVKKYQINYLNIEIVLFIMILLSGCTPATMTDVRTGIGQEYHVLKLPVMQHNIGSEWSKKFGATGKGMLTEDKIQVEKSLKRLDRGTENQITLGISALSETGINANAGVGVEAIKQINLHGLQIVKPVALGYIPFKPGVAYVTEALRLEGFAIDSNNRLKLQMSLTGLSSVSPGFGAENAANSGFGGEGLVLGYIIQMAENSSYKKNEYGPVALALNGSRVPIGAANVSSAASYEKIKAGSGKSLPKNLLWACKRAASKKDSINAAWVITLNITGEEKKTLKIAFPAHPEFEDCSEFENVVATGINSVTDQIERTVVRIVIDRSTVNEMFDPLEFGATVSATKEAFTIKTITPD